MDTNQLETFLTIAELKSFSKAAEILNITQPTVTARIKNLENELNCYLFQRQGKDVTVTPQGQIFFEYCSKIINYMNNAKDAIDQSKAPILKIGFCSGLSSSFILESISTLKSDQLKVNVTEGENSAALINKVKNGSIDAVFVRNLVSYDDDLVTEYLFDDLFVLITGKNHRLADQENITLDDLIYETLICYSPDHPIWSSIEQKLTRLQQVSRLEVENNDMLKTFVKNNWGISFSPLLGIDESEKDQIATKEIKEISEVPNKVYVIYRKNSLTESYIKKMVYSFINHQMLRQVIMETSN
ncbi:LysR family transcriptional regulator [Bacillus sp. EB600]|uniref:LysR family transcriptional regulator n=1 Tax=Bacillus sp. EB600 TaxID=2806345 RepID=UPI00210BE8E1|nr:LysR family transcriptional regulator [Bacillus sp. EB600]MCQ6279943.1 LysR family transcriptional regulator [Bacillus sp. EB600]